MKHDIMVLTDDGTLDTVIKCAGCGREYRYNYVPPMDVTGETYEEFVEWAIEDAADEHAYDVENATVLCGN